MSESPCPNEEVFTCRLNVPFEQFFLTHPLWLYTSCLCSAFFSILFVDRPGLKEPEKVEQLQMNMIGSLREHLTYNAQAKQNPHIFSRLLAKLPDLRSISEQGLQRIFYLNHEELVPTPPLIESLFLTTLPF